MFDKEYESFLLSRNKPHTVETYIQYLRHISAYHYLTNFIKNKKVLEVGVLNGYGHRIMSKHTDFLVGFDLLEKNAFETRDLIKDNFTQRLLVADCQELPFENESFDIIVLFHVFEHLEETEKFLTEAKRVLKTGGKLFATTPNRNLRLRPYQKPYQPEHVTEYTPEQFLKAFKGYFSTTELVGLSSPKKEFVESEKIRVQQWRNIFFAYFPYPFNQVVFTKIYQYFYKKKLDRIEKLGKDYFSVDDCIFSEKDIDNCIDIMAISTK